MRYRAFRDEVRAHGVIIPIPAKITFFLPMPAGWSQTKKAVMRGQPHTQPPDYDNLSKALVDSVFDEDGHVWSIWAEKRWADQGMIRIEEL